MIDSIIYKQRSRRRTRPSKWGARKAVVAVLTATSACSGFEVTGFPSGLRHNIITSKGSCHAFIPTMSTKQLYTRHPKFISGSGQGMMKDQNDFEPSVVGHTTADYPHNLTDNNPDSIIFDPQSEVHSAPSKDSSATTITQQRRRSIGFSHDQEDIPSEPCDLLFQQQITDPFRADFRDGSEPQLMTTFGGGTALMFEMIAKRMLDWGNEAKPYNVENENGAITSATPTRKEADKKSSPIADANSKVLPRWHPHSGISDANPNFRSQAPAMSNQGFAKSIWRNVRKRNKPSLWRNALRTYDRMVVLENDPSYLNIQRSNSHHEGAMLACAKLGLWQRALEIYHHVFQVEQESQAEFDQVQKQQLLNPTKVTAPGTVASIRRSRIRRTVQVTDHMISSLVGACVRASQQRAREKGTHLSPEQEEREAALRRIPLDTALEVLTTTPETHNIPLVARHVNPLASAYQSLGYIPQATEILQNLLSNRTAGEEPEDGMDIFNVYDLCAKDKASYSLLVQGAVVTGDWGAAVDALSDMNKAGLFPKQRHCNIWSEISERQTRPRAAGSWKKKRNDNWADSIL